MSIATVFDEFRRQVLVPELLSDPSRFLKGDFFDEIPLYSRYDQVEPFLRDVSTPDSFLLEMAVEYLEEVCDAARSSRGFFAAITVSDDKDRRYVVPSIFVCKGQVRRRLRGLRLRKPLTDFGKRIAADVKRIDSKKKLRVLEDTLTMPGEVRIFLSYLEMLDRVAEAAP